MIDHAVAMTPVVIRPLRVEELPLCVSGAEGFHREFQLPGRLIPEVFIRNWTTFLTQYTATILTAWQEERLLGGLGALVHPDLNDGRVVATEMFWYVMPEARGGRTAVRLLKAFIVWGESHAEETRLAHMLNGTHDAQLDRLYKKLGFRPLEMGYYRPRQIKELQSCLS